MLPLKKEPKDGSNVVLLQPGTFLVLDVDGVSYSVGFAKNRHIREILPIDVGTTATPFGEDPVITVRELPLAPEKKKKQPKPSPESAELGKAIKFRRADTRMNVEAFAATGGVSDSRLRALEQGRFTYITENVEVALKAWGVKLPAKSSRLWPTATGSKPSPFVEGTRTKKKKGKKKVKAYRYWKCPDAVNLGKKMTEVLEASGLSAEQFAEKGEVHITSLQTWRGGRFSKITERMEKALKKWGVPLPPKTSELWIEPLSAKRKEIRQKREEADGAKKRNKRGGVGSTLRCPDAVAIGEKIKARREELGLDTTEFGEIGDVTPESVRAWQAGKFCQVNDEMKVALKAWHINLPPKRSCLWYHPRSSEWAKRSPTLSVGVASSKSTTSLEW